MRPMRRAPLGWTLAAWGIAGLTFAFYGIHRMRFAGGCDSSSYLLEALRIRGLAPGLALDPGIPIRGPLAPLCLIERNGVVTSLFPPGFPLLLALGGAVGLQFSSRPCWAPRVAWRSITRRRPAWRRASRSVP
jgi:hypothetical protein